MHSTETKEMKLAGTVHVTEPVVVITETAMAGGFPTNRKYPASAGTRDRMAAPRAIKNVRSLHIWSP